MLSNLSFRIDFGYQSLAKLGLFLLGFAVIARGCRYFYRLYLHPLAAFPGLKQAAVSSDWYYQITRKGQPEEDIERLHEKFNAKAVRIAPNKLHISDVTLYKTVYSQTSAYIKDAGFYDAFHTPHTLFVETDPGMHKERRKMLNPYFSKQAVAKLDGIFYDKANALAAKLRRLYIQGKEGSVGAVDMYTAVRCATVEVISEYAFGLQINMIEESPDTLQAKFLDTFDRAAVLIIEGYHRPFSVGARFVLAALLPRRLVALVDPESLLLQEFQSYSHRCLQQHMTQNKEIRGFKHPVIFDNPALTSLPETQLKAEAVDILVAGSDTTAFSVSLGCYHILSHPTIQAKLVDALSNAIPDVSQMPRLPQLEGIPYLFACIKETLRYAAAVTSFLPRVVPDPKYVKGAQPLYVEGKLVPPGTVIGISAYTMHKSPELWGPDVGSFKPERWLEDDGTVGGNAKNLEQWMCTFSKGSRQCIGMNVAYGEMFVFFATLFRQFDLELPEGFALPKILDLFTQQVTRPGLLIKCQPRSA